MRKRKWGSVVAMVLAVGVTAYAPRQAHAACQSSFYVLTRSLICAYSDRWSPGHSSSFRVHVRRLCGARRG